jgi:hypothetical protein
MGLFMKAEVTSAFLKMGVMGFAGSGKTYTSAHTAIGLVEHMQSVGVSYADKPVFFLDTETGSDWVKPQFEAAGVPLFTAKTRAFQDLLAAVKEAEKESSLLLVDSISHFWKELCDAYMKRKNRNRLQFEDWSFLKGEWGKFTDQFINSQLHIIICGRAGYEYDYFQDEAGKKQLEKTGIKMKAEGEMGYEPSLLVLMEREMDMETNKVSRTASIIKDRSTAIDGQKFHNPTFESFMPHIKYLNLGGKQLGVDTSRTSEGSIPSDVRDNSRVHREIVLDEIQSLITRYYPGQTSAEKKTKLDLLKTHFQASWTEMERLMPLSDLRAGYDSLHIELEGQKSRYSWVTDTAPEMNDSIPDFCPPVEAAE